VSRAVGLAIAALGVLVVWAAATIAFRDSGLSLLPSRPAAHPLWLAAALGYALPCLGGVDALGLAALDLEQPRIKNLLRMARLVGAYALFIIAASAFLVAGLVPEAERSAWTSAPLAALALTLAAPAWLRFTMLAAVAVAAVVFLAATVRAAATGGHGALARLVDEGVLGEGFRGGSSTRPPLRSSRYSSSRTATSGGWPACTPSPSCAARYSRSQRSCDIASFAASRAPIVCPSISR